ncbi:MAG: putative LPS assembly protein LptD, partial [Gemmatimonadota bacterium]|nr:putative LPS assembly protein LptD [Gemmatimonadota bacterium]
MNGGAGVGCARRRWVGRGLPTVVLAAGFALVASARSVAAQATQEPDSARIKVLQRLQRLGRTVGADSALYLEDSLSTARAREGGGRGGPNVDSVRAVLLGIPGFASTEYEGGEASFEASRRVLTLLSTEGGKARVLRDGMEVVADSSITFDDSRGLVDAVGSPTMTPPEGRTPIESDRLLFDLSERRGTAYGARTEFSEGGGQWKVNGDIYYADQDSTFTHHAIFTSCDLDEPHYHFASDNVKMVAGKVLVARPVTLYFGDVPVAWLPFMAQSLAQGRSSGLLQPRFSINDIVSSSKNYRRRVSNIGFYWAMSDYSDALVSMDWFSDNYFALTGYTSYRVNKLFLSG